MTIETTREEQRELLRQTARSLLGPYFQTRIARATGQHRSHVSRWFNPPKGRNDAPPPLLLVTLELLALIPPDRWPDRWKEDAPKRPKR